MAFGFIKAIKKLLGGGAATQPSRGTSARGVRKDGRAQDTKRSSGNNDGRRRNGNGSSNNNTRNARPQERRPNGGTAPRRGDGQASGGNRPPRAQQPRRQEQASTSSGEGHDQGTRRARPERGARGGKRPERGEQHKMSRPQNTSPSEMRPGGVVTEAMIAERKACHATWSVEQYVVPVQDGKKRFHDFDLPSEVMHGIADLGFQYCTEIQALSLEHALAGKNVAGKAQTGTGKTAAFLVAILTRYLRTPEGRATVGGTPRALVLAPTRELVIQICKDADALGKYCNLRSLAIYGGMDYERQKEEVMDAPVDLLVATPGRLIDFCRSRVVDLSHVDTLVIDEADRMLDMGFIPDVTRIMAKLPPKDKRATMLYSATLNDDVMRLAMRWMEEPVKAEVEFDTRPAATIKQIVYVVTADEKFKVLYNHLMQYPDSRTLVFCNRKSTTEDVASSLLRRGVKCEMLSGDVNQNRRLRVLEDFREGAVRIVVATDVAGRGIHVDDLAFVINFDFPYEPEDYVHRIGRTGRAGHSGTAISFADEDESFIIPDIEKYIGEELHCTMPAADDPLLAPLPPKPPHGAHRGTPKVEPLPVAEVEPSAAEQTPMSEAEAPLPVPATDVTEQAVVDASADEKTDDFSSSQDVVSPPVVEEAATPPVKPPVRLPTGMVERPQPNFDKALDPKPIIDMKNAYSKPVEQTAKVEAWVPGQGK